MTGCVCPGDTLTYECTAMGVTGGSSTVWTGTAFECLCCNDNIILPHDLFSSRSCNNGDIVARGLSVEGNNYTSQLNVTVTPDTAGKTVECHRDNGADSILLFSR